MRVLVIEDDLQQAERMRVLLEGQQSEVTNLVTVRGAVPGRILGTLLNGSNPVHLLLDFDLAFVDGYLGEDSRVFGWDIIAALVESGIPVIACSSEESFNERMLAAGAHSALLKTANSAWEAEVVMSVRTCGVRTMLTRCPPGVSTGRRERTEEQAARGKAYVRMVHQNLRDLIESL